MPRGGPQPGSGRPKGRHNKCTTLTLPIPAYNELISRAQKAGSTVSQYIIDALELPREGKNTDLTEKTSVKELMNQGSSPLYQIDDGFQMAAEGEESSSYKVDSKKEEK